VLSESEFEFHILDHEDYIASIYGDWNEENSGGCVNYKNESWEKNPLVRLKIPKEASIVIELSQPDEQIQKGYGIGLYVFKGENRPLNTLNVVAKTRFVQGNRQIACRFPKVSEGIYSIAPCTYAPKQFGKWKLTVLSASCLPVLEKI